MMHALYFRQEMYTILDGIYYINIIYILLKYIKNGVPKAICFTHPEYDRIVNFKKRHFKKKASQF